MTLLVFRRLAGRREEYLPARLLRVGHQVVDHLMFLQILVGG